PTFAKAAGAKLPDVKLDGFDMLPMLSGEKPSPREEMFWQRRSEIGARVGQWKWVQSEKGGGLFDLSKDLEEKTDLSREHPGELAMVKSRYEAWHKAMDDSEPRGPFRDY